ncbi:unnamed protein product [Trichogramma brassicae]|uniref:Reverse transcriptase domain-containing protein n=1 Tax=Trichogramma brassicae TaxID=86971 RepID=A0A6H5J4A5_9HYME|nr:unnamed protein product [Trichogramma brassicae]
MHRADEAVSTLQMYVELAALGCSRRVVKFVKFVTRERFIHLQGDSLIRRMFKGVPQGAVLSPLLYSLYVASIAVGIPPTVRISQFADDVSISVVTDDPEKGVRVLEGAISELERGLDDVGLNISPPKSKFIHFNVRNIAPGKMKIKIQNHIIPSCGKNKFLGVIFDYQLSFKDHIAYIQTRCNTAMNIMKFLCGTYWGSHPDTLLRLYETYVRSILDYGSFVYFPKNAGLKTKLERIQFAAIRTALGYRRSTPTNILLAEAKISSVEERAGMLGRKYVARALCNDNLEMTIAAKEFYQSQKSGRRPSGCLSRCIFSVLGDEYRIQSRERFDPYNNSYYSTLMYSAVLNVSLGQDIKSSPAPNRLLNEYIEARKATPIYTDGSKVKGAPSVGYAVYCPRDEYRSSGSLSPISSIFTAECCAIIGALEHIALTDGERFMIVSDSLSALLGVGSLRTRSDTMEQTLEIKRRIAALSSGIRGKEIELLWIPSHIGLESNEEVDALARSATLREHPRASFVRYSDLAAEFSKVARNNTEAKNKMDGQEKGRTYFELFHNDRAAPWFSGSGLS